MNKIINFTETEKNILKLSRAISDLKSGFPVIYVNNEAKFLFFATEYLIPSVFDKIKNLDVALSISDKRIGFIQKNHQTKHGFVKLKSALFSDVKNLIFNDKVSSEGFAPDFTHEEELQNIHKFMVEAEMIPSICFLKIETNEYSYLSEIEAELIGSYSQIISHELFQSVETILHLKTTKPVKIRGYTSIFGGKDHYAIIVGNPELDRNPLVRIHSSCYTGDLLGSLSCDCGDQLKLALKIMDESTEFHGGVLIYLMQEGRGIGLTNKLRTYDYQEKGLDTVDANIALGLPEDARGFAVADKILDDLNIKSLTLLTNNPRKSKHLTGFGKIVTANYPLTIESNMHNEAYLATKSQKLGHVLPKSSS